MALISILTSLVKGTADDDNMCDEIKTFCRENGWSCQMYKVPWQDFEWNRTAALKLAYGLGDYLVLTDADYVWKSSKPDGSWVRDVLLKSPQTKSWKVSTLANCLYIRPHVIRSTLKVRFERATHEFLAYIDHPGEERILGDELKIHHIGDGGCKADKFIRDKLALEKDLVKYGERDSRTNYYMGQTLRCLGELNGAIDFYERRVDIGGWRQEVYYSMFQHGTALKDLKRPIKRTVLPKLLEAFVYEPTRLESLFNVMEILLAHGHHKLACSLAGFAMFNTFPPPTCLFVEQVVFFPMSGRRFAPAVLVPSLTTRPDGPFVAPLVECARLAFLGNLHEVLRLLSRIHTRRHVADPTPVARTAI